MVLRLTSPPAPVVLHGQVVEDYFLRLFLPHVLLRFGGFLFVVHGAKLRTNGHTIVINNEQRFIKINQNAHFLQVS